jgi:lipoprotein-anchoring transpeptidase ErfK/SrfK
MNEQFLEEARVAVQKAQAALRQGNQREAHQWASQAARLAPEWEAPWLILAAVSTPNASIYFLKRALEINPVSERARQGMHWAIKRQLAQSRTPESISRQITSPEETTRMVIRPAAAPRPTVARAVKKNYLPYLVPIFAFLLIICIGLGIFLGFSPGGIVFAKEVSAARPEGLLEKPSLTPTRTFTPTPTYTFTPSPTPTETPTPTPTFTETPLPTETPTWVPTETPIPEVQSLPISPVQQSYPVPGNTGERWIDINLSQQMLYAYEGNQVIGSFLVSTGTWEHPTVTGQYSIYVKYLYTDMSGPGYYLPDVPYTMYFYSGYGIHGTYWHHNFGTPMSHGCVNMYTPDAEWLFNWASVGTLVNIHY